MVTSWYWAPVMIHSGWNSCLVAAFVSEPVIAMSVKRITLVTPAPFSLVMRVGAASSAVTGSPSGEPFAA